MADIFISYSSHDRAKASALCGKLRAAGISVWIDESGISAATQWTDEIVKAIEECSIFIILLSHSALESHNVIKELTLASEEKKYIIPVELEPVEITTAIKYQLAGIQRVPFKDFNRIADAVHRFLGKQAAPAIPVVQPIKRKSILLKLALPFMILAVVAAVYFFNAKKSGETTVLPPDDWMPHVVESKIAVLPFEFLSSDKDDEYFADGLTSEVISSLAHLQGMIVTNRKAAMEYKGKKTDPKAIASSLGVRYIVDGTIQKEGKNVKISAELLDIETGKTMLTEKFEGTTDDRILLQERLALTIAFELQGSIGRTGAIDTNIIRQMTGSPEAAQAIRDGDKYALSANEEGWTQALPYFRKVSELDPKFIFAFYQIAVASLRRYPYSHLKSDLDAADSAMNTINRLNPSYRLLHYCKRLLAGIKGDHEGEIREQKILVAKAPEDALGTLVLPMIITGRESLIWQRRTMKRSLKEISRT